MVGYNWKVGQVAFFGQREFLKDTDAAATACLPPQAFGHPAIILRISEETGYALVTNITAFGSGPHNNFLPPWDHPFHCHKPRHLIRSFEGTERPPARGKGPQAPFLCLREGKMMPKKKTSWVYIRWSYITPISALVTFDKSAYRLELTEASLNALIDDMTQSSHFVANWADPRVAESRVAMTTTKSGATKKAMPLATKKTAPVTTTTNPPHTG